MALFQKKKPVKEPERIEVDEILDSDAGEIKKSVKEKETTPTVITQEQMIISQNNYVISLLETINKKLDYIKAKSDEA